MIAVLLISCYDKQSRKADDSGRDDEMIAFLKGMVEDITENSLVLDVHGVGYEVLVPGQILDRMGETGQEIKLYTYMQVREDAVILFGFLTKDDLQMFRMLIAVNGVGPKAGLAILSALGADDLRFAVLADDAKRIAKTPGIGAKTAQKIILELKDKLDLEDAFEKKLNADRITPETAVAAGAEMVQDAVEALVALGYGNTEALKAVRAVKGADFMDVEQLLKEALKHMSF